MTEILNPKIIVPDTSWWKNLVETNLSNPSLKEPLLELEIVKSGNKLTANTPDGRREVDFTTVSGTPAVAYKTDSGRIKCFPFPGLPGAEITRNGNPNKHGWTIEEE